MKFSLICPVYNEELFLNDMLASLVAQTHQDWEALLIDDGSTDNSASIIENWAAKDDRIKPVSLRVKLGKVHAFNLAFSKSTGDLICHVGGDDFLTPSSLTDRESAFREADPFAVVFAKLQVIDENGAAISSPIPRGQYGSQSSPGATYSRALANLIFPIPTDLPSEDIWLGNAAAGCAQSVIHLQTPVIFYRIHSNNSNPRHKSFDEMTKAIHSRYQALDLLLESDLPLSEASRKKLQAFAAAEQLRYARQTLKILWYKDLPLIDRVAISSMSNPALWRIRQKLGVAATGWRGK